MSQTVLLAIDSSPQSESAFECKFSSLFYLNTNYIIIAIYSLARKQIFVINKTINLITKIISFYNLKAPPTLLLYSTAKIFAKVF